MMKSEKNKLAFIKLIAAILFSSPLAAQNSPPENFVDLNGEVFKIPLQYLFQFSGSPSSISRPIKTSSFAFAYQMPEGVAPSANISSRPIDEIGENGSFSVSVYSVEGWTSLNNDQAGRGFTNVLMWQGIDAYRISSAHGLIQAEPIADGDGQMIWLLGTKQISFGSRIFWVSSLTRCRKSGGQCVSDIYVEQMKIKMRILFYSGHIDGYWPIVQTAVFLLQGWSLNSR